MRKVIVNFDKKSQAVYLSILNSIILGCTDNEHFPDLPYPITVIIALKKEYEKKLNKSKTGSHLAVAECKELKKDLNWMILQNGNYINTTAAGNETMLLSSGYLLSKPKVYKPIPELRFKHYKSRGTGKIIIGKVKGAVAYLIQICTESELLEENEYQWEHLMLTTKKTILLEGYEPFKLYWIRFKSVSYKGETGFSMPFSIYL